MTSQSNDARPQNRESAASHDDEARPVSFQQAADEATPGLIAEFIEFLGESKKWWLTPIIVILLLVGLIVLNSTVIAPFIYPLF